MKALSSAMRLSWQLFRNTLGAKYRRSYLGYLWMVVPALAITGGVSLASQSGVIRSAETPLPFPLFVFIGIIIWQVFAESVEVSHKAFEGARSYLTKVNCSREAVVLAQFYETLIIAGVRMALLLAVILLFGRGGWHVPGVIALCFAGALTLGLGIGALLMPFTILFGDFQHAVKMALTYGVFLTPAFYLPQGTGWLSRLVAVGPLAAFMASARDAAAGMVLSQPGWLLVTLGLSFLALGAGLCMVRLAAPILVERMLVGGR